MTLDSRIPVGPLAEKWSNTKFETKLVAPQNRRKFEIIIVGTGLAGGAAAVIERRSHHRCLKPQSRTPLAYIGSRGLSDRYE